METLTSVLDQTFLDISLGRFAAALGVLIAALVVKRILAHMFNRFLLPIAQKSRTKYDDLFLDGVRKPAEFLVLIGGLFVILHILQLPSEPTDIDGFAHALLKVLITFDIAWLLFNMAALFDIYLERWVAHTESTLDDQMLPFLRKSLRAFIVFIAILMVIQNLGYSISGLLASLGIGGLAIALAAKDTLSNIFGSLMIILDRPFHIGDWIKAGDMEGTVEEVGFRSTKIRTFAETLITVPNNKIADMPLDNFSRMTKRRIKLNIGVTYETTPTQMRTAVENIRNLLRTHPAIDQKFMLVHFTDFGESSLDILIYCFTTTTVWGQYLEAREDINLKIMDILEQLGVGIAFPSRSVYLQGTTPEPG
jgi:MscS family membrane protein